MSSLAGTYNKVHIASNDTAVISLDDAAISHLEADLAGGSVTAGVVRTLTVEQPDVCPVREDYDEHSRLHVQAVSGGKMTYNDVERAAKSINSDCGTVVVGDVDNTGEEL